MGKEVLFNTWDIISNGSCYTHANIFATCIGDVQILGQKDETKQNTIQGNFNKL
jgi:hypothetical protein